MSFIILCFIITIFLNFFPEHKYFVWLHRKSFIFELFFFQWRVFAPKPANTDLHVYIRDLKFDNTTTKLKKAEFFTSYCPYIINSNHRERLLLNGSYKLEKFESNTYKVLKKCINKVESKVDIKSRQLTIVRTYGYFSDKEDEIVLIDNI